MEDKKNLVNWALGEFESNLLLKEQRWNFFEKQPFYDYKCLLTINQRTFEGRGVSLSQTQAIAASISEAMERYAIDFQNKGFPSSGCAAYTNKEQAIINSRFELTERHFVMLYSLGYSNASVVEFNSLPNEMKPSIQILNEKGIEVNVYILSKLDGQVVTLCKISGLSYVNKFGFVFGSSCKSSFKGAAIASYLEALPNVMAFLNQNIKSLTICDFKKIERPKPEDHLSLYLDAEFANCYQLNAINKLTDEKRIDPSLFKTEELLYPYSYMLPVFRSLHPDCIDACWGLLPLSIYPNNLNPNFPFVLP